MYRIQTFNKISPLGLSKFDPERYSVSDSESNPDGILVRSAKLLDYEFPSSLLAIARAGVGVNNIPLTPLWNTTTSPSSSSPLTAAW